MTCDLSAEALADSQARDTAGRMAGALTAYARHRHFALAAERRHDTYSARLHRADARVALHAYPDLLVVLEPPERVARSSGPVPCGPCGTGGQYDYCQAHDWHRAR